MTKRKPRLYRDSHGRFVSLPPEARAKLEAMRGRRITQAEYVEGKRGPGPIDVTTFMSTRKEYATPLYEDAIYRPKRKGWLERALHWFTWNRSRA